MTRKQKKVIIPNGDDIIMLEESFNQNPEMFMNWVIGMGVIGRVNNRQSDRLPLILDGISGILNKQYDDKPWAFEDFKIVRDCLY